MDTMDCRCCGKPVLLSLDEHPIHPRCSPRHWGLHAYGENATRCHEFTRARRDTTGYVDKEGGAA